MKLILRYNYREIVFAGNLIYYVTNFFKKFLAKIQNKYPEIEFEIRSEPEYERFGNGGIHSCMSCSILNSETNKYILISFWDDWKYHFYKHLGWQPSKMTEFYYCGSFNFVDYFNFKRINEHNNDVEHPSDIRLCYKSFFYGPYFDSQYNEIDEIYNDRKAKSSFISDIKFRGFMWEHRKRMTDNLPSNSYTIIDKNVDNQTINYLEYLKELSNYKCALSLPGNTNICNRDMECFAVGVPVLRPSFDNILEDPLWPDYHYLSFYHSPKYWDGNCSYVSYQDFQQNLTEYWEKIKDNSELLDFISVNAYEWFKRNSTADKNVDYILSKLNLDSLLK